MKNEELSLSRCHTSIGSRIIGLIGISVLAEKLEVTRTELKADIARVEQRVTAVAADLAAHRRDGPLD